MKHLPVIIVTSFMGDLRRTGGVAKHIQLLTKGLLSRGLQVKIVDRRSLGPIMAFLISAPKVLDSVVPCLGTGVWALLAGYTQRLLIWSRHRGPGLWIFEDPYAFLPDKEPSLLFVHSLESEVISKVFGLDEGCGVKWLRSREVKAVKQAETTVAVSHEYAKVIEEEIGIKAQIIENAMDLDCGSLRRKPPASQKLELLAVGVLNERKNFRFLIEVVDGLVRKGVNTHLTIVGEGKLSSTIASDISAKNLGDKVSLLGFVDEQRLTACYETAHFFLHPSLHEAFGIVLLEARKYGLVTAISDRIDVPDELYDHRLRLDVSEWVRVLADYANDPDRIGLVADQGHLRAKERFSLDSLIDKVLALFETGQGLR